MYLVVVALVMNLHVLVLVVLKYQINFVNYHFVILVFDPFSFLNRLLVVVVMVLVHLFVWHVLDVLVSMNQLSIYRMDFLDQLRLSDREILTILCDSHCHCKLNLHHHRLHLNQHCLRILKYLKKNKKNYYKLNIFKVVCLIKQLFCFVEII